MPVKEQKAPEFQLKAFCIYLKRVFAKKTDAILQAPKDPKNGIFNASVDQCLFSLQAKCKREAVYAVKHTKLGV